MTILNQVFTVEWTPATDVPIINGEADFDHRQKQKNFSTFDGATAFAKAVIEEDFFGEIRIDRDVWGLVDYGNFQDWEWTTAETWFYTGDGEPYKA